jgi:hypothetical protein
MALTLDNGDASTECAQRYRGRTTRRPGTDDNCIEYSKTHIRSPCTAG